MTGIDHERIHVGHLTVEIHSWLQLRHVLHAAHHLVLGNHRRGVFFRKSIVFHNEISVFHFRHLGAENRCQHVSLKRREISLLVIVLANETLRSVGIDTDKASLLQFAFQHSYRVAVKLSVKEKHIVAFLLGTLNVGILTCFVGSIEVYHRPLLVCLCSLDKCAVFIKSVIVSVHILEEEEFFCRLIEFLIREHAVFYEDFDIVPFFLKLLAVILKHSVEFLCDFLRDVG